ncbi:MAG: ABC transporter substrate-binding protein [Verrucomicrobia bacterium]|jgi:ABC transporter binding protein (urea carboxylase system)|nr:ABC transporter substrate-binding protein [Verrucomicrobiota bacterium]
MKKNTVIYFQAFIALCLTMGLPGCGVEQTTSTQSLPNLGEEGSENTSNQQTATSKESGLPTFSLAWSEYPSWSTFGVAHVDKFINGKKGELGPIEEKWKVDIVLHEADYDTCITMYGAGQVDAACLTNMDALNPSIGRPSTMILPTSTSHGADACIVVNSINSLEDLKGKKVYGLEKSVSEYCFVRNLENAGHKEKDFSFSNMDPSAASAAMQQKQAGVEAIMVWNPFVLETLSKRSDVKVLFDSTGIPSEIIDSVIMAQSSLSKEGGEAFACAIAEAFYTVAERMNQPDTRDATLTALGEKFSNLDLAAMNNVVRQTKFLTSPGEAIALFNGQELPQIMDRVVTFCVDHEITGRAPELSYGKTEEGNKAELRFDPTYIQMVASQ